MRDVSAKPISLRSATAEATLTCAEETLARIRSGDLPKADPVGVARVAGIQAAKQTSLLIPYCHQVPLDHVALEITEGDRALRIRASVRAVWKTGVEMEALTAASAAALTLYDMLKIIDDTMEIRDVRLTAKKGGKSDFRAPAREAAAAVIVLSDSAAKGTRKDSSGETIRRRLALLGVRVGEFLILPDERAELAAALRRIADAGSTDLIVTTGGTGVGPRDTAPEATQEVIERPLPGVAEALRAHGQERNRFAMLSRGVAGVRGRTLIVNLPGSEAAVTESLDLLLPWILHALEILRGGGHPG